MDKIKLIEGVILTQLKIIESDNGDVMRYLREDDNGFNYFKESYFSTVKKDSVKAWKKHIKMTLNIAVPVGKIKFVLFDDRKDSLTTNTFNELILSPKNYFRLTVPPGLWMAFKGLEEFNLLINTADLIHDPNEIVREKLNYFNYDF